MIDTLYENGIAIESIARTVNKPIYEVIGVLVEAGLPVDPYLSFPMIQEIHQLEEQRVGMIAKLYASTTNLVIDTLATPSEFKLVTVTKHPAVATKEILEHAQLGFMQWDLEKSLGYHPAVIQRALYNKLSPYAQSIKDRLAKGEKAVDLAAEFDVSPAAISYYTEKKRKMAKYARPDWDAVEIDLSKGMSIAEVAKKHKCSRTAIYKRRKRCS